MVYIWNFITLWYNNMRLLLLIFQRIASLELTGGAGTL